MSEPAYCKQCGQSLEERFVAAEERERLVCVGCGHIHYLNPIVVAGTIPHDEGRIWMLRRAIQPRANYWTFPAGYMELGETVEVAACRETLEEVGLEIEIERLLNVYSRANMSTVHVVYVARALSTPHAGQEALEIRAFRPDEIPWDDLAFWTTHKALHEYLGSLETASLSE